MSEQPPAAPPPEDPNDVSTPDHPAVVPIDLRELLAGNPPEVRQLIAPIIAAGRHVGIVAKRGEGKSLLALDMGASAATGTPCIEQPAGEPFHVIYIDMEMGPEDLYDRLIDLGHTPDSPTFDTLIEHLHYYQLPALPPLDTEAGGVVLEHLVQLHGAQLVIIDTVSRVISGRENDAEPFLDLFRHTETRLKRQGVAMLRLDHFGKDNQRGSRGHSAKEDPLDIVWELNVTGDNVTLKRTKGRQVGVPDQLHLVRDDANGTLTHRIPASTPISAKATEVVQLLTRLDAPPDLSIAQAQQLLQQHNNGRSRAAIVEAVRYRRNTSQPVPEPPQRTEPQNRSRTTPEPSRTTENSHPEPRVPPKRGTGVRGPEDNQPNEPWWERRERGEAIA